MKKLLAAVVVVVVVAIGALWWLRGNVDGLVKAGIEKYGSEMTQARVSVSAVEIRAVDGRGIIRGLTIGNPEGFKTPHAFSVGEIEVAIDAASILKDVVVIRRISISAPDVIYERGEGLTNFDALQRNIARYLGPAEKAEKKEGGKKLIVEQLVIRNAKAQASAAFMGGKTVSVPLPDIMLHDIGKAKGGVTPGELGQTIAEALKQRLSSAISFERLMKSTGKLVEDAAKTVKGLFGR